MTTRITNWVKEYCIKSGINHLVIGISGGIDSAVVSTLCCETGIPTTVVSLPISQKEDQLQRARNHAYWLQAKYDNCTFVEVDLTDVSKLFEQTVSLFKDELSDANSRSRFRMVTLYQIAGKRKGLVVGTGNKVEDFGVGFYTKYGDGGVDISPIADFTKTEVRELAKQLNIIDEIIQAKPTDGLWGDDKTDEDQLGATYEELEWAMDYVETGSQNELTRRENDVLAIYKTRNAANKHKMVPIPVFKK